MRVFGSSLVSTKDIDAAVAALEKLTAENAHLKQKSDFLIEQIHMACHEISRLYRILEEQGVEHEREGTSNAYSLH